MSTIIESFLQFQTIVRLFHWKTKSYPRHIASGGLYEKLDPLFDSFIEIYQGKMNGKEKRIRYKPFKISYREVSEREIVLILEAFKGFLLTDLDKILQKMRNTDLFNIRDEILAQINQTLYLFTLQ